MRSVYVGGVGSTAFAAHEALTLEQLGARAVAEALRDAGLDRKAVQSVYVGHMSQGEVAGQRVLKEMGFPEIPVTNIENACASGSSAFREAWINVGAGMCDVALVLGIEKLATKGLIAMKSQSFEERVGHIMPGSYALAGERHMAEYGTTTEDLAKIAVKNRTNGAANEKAMYRKPCNLEEVLASRKIAGPLTLLQCCGTASGASAIVLVGGKAARSTAARKARVRACALSSKMQWGEPEDLTIFMPTHRAAKAAYEYAGIGPEEINVVELHDAFTVGELLHYEGLMLCGRGEGAGLVRSGATNVDGRIPVNASGGLLARGHPVGATGVVQIAELVNQLCGRAAHHQIPNAKVALAQSQRRHRGWCRCRRSHDPVPMTHLLEPFMKRIVLSGLLAALTLLAPLWACAQEAYPSRPIRMIVPFPPGGGADIVARDFAAQIARNLNAQVVVENRPGAGAQIGTESVAKAPADGYTLLFATTHHAINPSLRKALPYDSRKDFTPIALVGSVYSAIVVRSDYSATTLAELIAMAKQQPGKISYGSTGIGGSTHLSGELLSSMAGIQLTHVPYKGGQQALADLLGGQIPMHIDTVNGVQSVYAAGRIRILAVTSPSRLSSLPNIPTVAEAGGLPGYQSAGWYMLMGPAGLLLAIWRSVRLRWRNRAGQSPAATACPGCRAGHVRCGAEHGVPVPGDGQVVEGDRKGQHQG